jgi:predicted ATPase
LEQLKVMPDLPDRIQQEIDILLTLGKSFAATAGSAAPEVERVYARAHALCRQMGETPQLLIVLLGLQLFYAVRGELETARELAERCLRLAQQAQDVNFLLWSHLALGNTLFQLGDLVPARLHLEQGAALYTPQKEPCSSSSSPVEGARIGCLCWLAFSLWALGYPNQALQRIREAQTQAQELNHPYSLVIAFTCAAALYVFRREACAAREQAEVAIAIATEQGFAQWLGLATVLQGWALAEQGHDDEGFAQMRQGTVTYRNTGAELSLPHQLAFFAEACEKTGQIEEGLKALAEALAIVNKTGARFNEAELYRLKGELSLQSGGRSPQSPIPNP